MFIAVVMDVCCGDGSAGGATATPQLHMVVLGFRFHLFSSFTTLFCLVMPVLGSNCVTALLKFGPKSQMSK